MRLIFHLLILILFMSCFPTAPDNSGLKSMANLSDSTSNNDSGDISVIQKFIKVNPLFSTFNYIVSENSSFITNVNIVNSAGAILTQASGVLEVGVFSDSQCNLPVVDGYVGSPITTVTNGVATFSGFGLTKPASEPFVVRFLKFTYNSGQSICTSGLRVYAMLLSYSNSLVTIQDGTGTYVNTTSGFKNVSRQIKVTLKNSLGVQLSSGGYVVTLAQSGGTSSLSIGSVVDNGDGTYSATLSGLAKGSQKTITASISGSPLTSTAAKYTVDNSPPAISTISDQTVQQYLSGSPISYTVTDLDGDAVSCGSPSNLSSTNGSVFTVSPTQISGTAPNCIYNLKNIGSSGSATIKMKYTDGTTISSERSFTINSVSPAILQLQDAPIFRGVLVNYPMTKTFLLKNVGFTKATNITILENMMDPFVLTDIDCTTLPVLNPGDSCSFQVQYTPTAVKVDQGTVSFSYFDGVGVRRYAQTFAGNGEQIRLSQSTLDFSAVRINAVNGTAERILTIHNPTEHQIKLGYQIVTPTTGDGSYFFNGGVFPGNIHHGISLTNGCIDGALIASKESCQIAITYQPLSTNTFISTFQIQNTYIASSPFQTVTLKGYGYVDNLTGLDIALNTCTCDPMTFGSCGDGSTGNPYLICSKDNIEDIVTHFNVLSNKSFKLVQDIDMSGYSGRSIGEGIGPFTGQFNGNNFSLRGYSPTYPILPATLTLKGLFSQTVGAAIFNLNIPDANASFANINSGGLLIGYAKDTTLKNIFVQGNIDINGSNMIGGLVGNAQNLQIATSNVLLRFDGGTDSNVAGLVGNVDGLQIDDSSVSVMNNIMNSNYISGVFGNGRNTLSLSSSGVHFFSNGDTDLLAGVGSVSDGSISTTDFNLFGTFRNSDGKKASAFLTNLISTSAPTSSIIDSTYISSDFQNGVASGAIGEVNLTLAGSSLKFIDVNLNTEIIGEGFSSGLISNLDNGELLLSNLTNVFQFLESNVGTSSIGGLISYASSNADSISLTGVTVLTDQTDTSGPSGGIAGKLDTSNMTITGADIFGKIQSAGHAGGLSGEWITPKVKLTNNFSNIISDNTCAGFVGIGSSPSVSSSLILESTNFGNIFGGQAAAGLVGDVFSSDPLSSFVIKGNYVAGTISGNTVSSGLVGLLGSNPIPVSEQNVVVLDTFVSNTSDIFPFGSSSHSGADYFWMSDPVNSIEKPIWYPTSIANEKFYSGTQMSVQGNFSNLTFPTVWAMGGFFHFPMKQ